MKKNKFPWLELLKHFITAALTFLASLGYQKTSEAAPPESKYNNDTVYMQLLVPDFKEEYDSLAALEERLNQFENSKN